MAAKLLAVQSADGAYGFNARSGVVVHPIVEMLERLDAERRQRGK